MDIMIYTRLDDVKIAFFDSGIPDRVSVPKVTEL